MRLTQERRRGTARRLMPRWAKEFDWQAALHKTAEIRCPSSYELSLEVGENELRKDHFALSIDVRQASVDCWGYHACSGMSDSVVFRCP
jgi:hypothetical protein